MDVWARNYRHQLQDKTAATVQETTWTRISTCEQILWYVRKPNSSLTANIHSMTHFL